MKINNISRPMQKPENGDLIEIIYDNGSIEKKTFFDFGEIKPKISDIISLKISEVKNYAEKLRSQPFEWNGNIFKIDEDTIHKTTTAAMMHPATDPLPTKNPDGKFMLNDGTYIDMTCGDFQQMSLALYQRGSTIEGNLKRKIYELNAMATDGSTYEQINAYRIDKGW